MARQGAQIEGQGVLVGPDMVPYPINLGARNSLARALRHEYFAINPNDYLDLTPEIAAHITPERLRPGLIDTKSTAPCAVGYFPGGEQRLRYIALTPSEYEIVVRSPEALGKAVVNRTLASRPRELPIATHAQAAERSGQHAFLGKAEKMQKYLDNALIPQGVLISKFIKAAKHPGLSLMGSEANMRQNFESLRTIIINDALIALRTQYNWTDEQALLTERIIIKEIVLDRAGNRHLSNFKGYIRLLKEYNGNKQALFRDRLAKVKSNTRVDG